MLGQRLSGIRRQHYKDTDAQFSLGLFYLYGHGVVGSNNKARHWLRLAADQNHKDAVTYLASCQDTLSQI